MNPLDRSVAIVTGGAIGIGFAIAQGLAERGAQVMIADREGSGNAAEKLGALGCKAAACQVDVSSPEQVDAMVRATVERFGRIDSLVNNAGIYSTLKPKPFEELEVDEWRRVFEVNVIGVFLCCKAVLPEFKKGGGGRIVNIASGVAFKGNPWMAHYVASKGAVVSMTRALATELGRHGVLVNCVAPGFTLSEGVNRNAELVSGVREPSLRNRVLARDMLPEDLAGAIEFFCGAQSSFITGQTLVVDGGAYFH
jgi:NAD(P)-dependent dehydrogenase (short-subunit alcohol dehydrogenase family)